MALAIPVKNPGCRLRVIRVRTFLGPLGHFRGKDVEMAIAVNVGNLKAVAVHHGTLYEVVADPILRPLRVANAFIPAQRPDTVSRGDDHLRILPGLKSAGNNPAAHLADLDRVELFAAPMLEP